MGQKINPLGFRLGTTQRHHSFWFTKPKNYSKSLQEDQKIRDYIKNYVHKNMGISSDATAITRIEILKIMDVIEVRISTGLPRTVLIKRGGIEELIINLKKDFQFHSRNLKLNTAIKEIAKPYAQPNILAEFIAKQLKERVSFRIAMKKAIELAEQADTKGIKVQIGGRINGKDIARIEWLREGRVPLQTIRAKIDYCSYKVRTIDGVLGIKIWIFMDEK
nr:ribosomal protein S3 [Pteridophyllum racemosum]